MIIILEPMPARSVGLKTRKSRPHSFILRMAVRRRDRTMIALSRSGVRGLALETGISERGHVLCLQRVREIGGDVFAPGDATILQQDIAVAPDTTGIFRLPVQRVHIISF